MYFCTFLLIRVSTAIQKSNFKKQSDGDKKVFDYKAQQMKIAREQCVGFQQKCLSEISLLKVLCGKLRYKGLNAKEDLESWTDYVVNTCRVVMFTSYTRLIGMLHERIYTRTDFEEQMMKFKVDQPVVVVYFLPVSYSFLFLVMVF